MYRANYTKPKFHDEEGNELTKDEAAEEMMWRSRESIWGTLPPTRKHSWPMDPLSAYCAQQWWQG